MKLGILFSVRWTIYRRVYFFNIDHGPLNDESYRQIPFSLSCYFCIDRAARFNSIEMDNIPIRNKLALDILT